MYTFHARPHCPLCGATKTRSLLELPFTAPPLSDFLQNYYGGRVPLDALSAGTYRLCVCETCGAGYQAELLDDAGMEALYETWINAEASFQKKQTAPLSVRVGYARQCTQIVKAVGKPPHEIRALDLGMGWGTWLLMARAFGMQTFGLELSTRRIEHAQAHGLTVVDREDIAADSLDFINAEQVFEHLPDPRADLLACHRWLKVGGWLRIAVPDGRDVVPRVAAGQWQPDDMPSQPLEHINIFTADSLRRFGQQNGFTPMQPPLVLPAFGLHPSELKQAAAVLGGDLLGRWGLRRSTVIWLRRNP